MTEPATCPPLGTGSVDMHALNEAARRGEDLNEALEKARTRAMPPEPEPESAAPKGKPKRDDTPPPAA